MKTNIAKQWTALCAAFLTAAAVSRVAAQPAPANAPALPDKTYTGTIVSVNPQDRVLDTKGLFLFGKKFNLGDACTYTLLDNQPGTVNDLRPGQKVRVTYQDDKGVLIADGVVQEPMRYEGMVQAINPDTHTLTIHLTGRDKTFQIAGDCAVMLRDDKSGSLGDIQTGDYVTVTYETPGHSLLAQEIAQTSMQFTGTLTAIDLGQKTLKASATFGSKKFNVADDCAIVINGRADGRLSDLRPDERLVISYDPVNGVNVVNRIAPAGGETKSVASATANSNSH